MEWRIKFRRVDEPKDEQPYSRYVGTFEDQFGNLHKLIQWWRPGLWVLVLRDEELRGKRWEVLKSCYLNRREFIR